MHEDFDLFFIFCKTSQLSHPVLAPASSAALYNAPLHWPAVDGLHMLAAEDGDADGQLEAAMLLPFPRKSGNEAFAPENTPNGLTRHDLPVPERLPAVPDKVPDKVQVNAVGAGAVRTPDVEVDMNELLQELQAMPQLPTNSAAKPPMNSEAQALPGHRVQAKVATGSFGRVPPPPPVNPSPSMRQERELNQVLHQQLPTNPVPTNSLNQQLKKERDIDPALHQQLPTNSMNQQLPARARAAAIAEDIPGKGNDLKCLEQ